MVCKLYVHTILKIFVLLSLQLSLGYCIVDQANTLSEITVDLYFRQLDTNIFEPYTGCPLIKALSGKVPSMVKVENGITIASLKEKLEKFCRKTTLKVVELQQDKNGRMTSTKELDDNYTLTLQHSNIGFDFPEITVQFFFREVYTHAFKPYQDQSFPNCDLPLKYADGTTVLMLINLLGDECNLKVRRIYDLDINDLLPKSKQEMADYNEIKEGQNIGLDITDVAVHFYTRKTYLDDFKLWTKPPLVHFKNGTTALEVKDMAQQLVDSKIAKVYELELEDYKPYLLEDNYKLESTERAQIVGLEFESVNVNVYYSTQYKNKLKYIKMKEAEFLNTLPAPIGTTISDFKKLIEKSYATEVNEVYQISNKNDKKEEFHVLEDSYKLENNEIKILLGLDKTPEIMVHIYFKDNKPKDNFKKQSASFINLPVGSTVEELKKYLTPLLQNYKGKTLIELQMLNANKTINKEIQDEDVLRYEVHIGLVFTENLLKPLLIPQKSLNHSNSSTNSFLKKLKSSKNFRTLEILKIKRKRV